MVSRGRQLKMERKVERLFSGSCGKPVSGFEKTMIDWGFTQTGGDLLALQFEHHELELVVEVILDSSRCIHGYRILTFPEQEARQQKVRW